MIVCKYKIMLDILYDGFYQLNWPNRKNINITQIHHCSYKCIVLLYSLFLFCFYFLLSVYILPVVGRPLSSLELLTLPIKWNFIFMLLIKHWKFRICSHMHTYIRILYYHSNRFWLLTVFKLMWFNNSIWHDMA